MRPNILFFLIDGLRADQCFGKDKTSYTPNIDSLIQKGTYFSNAFTSVDGTIVSLNTIFSSNFQVGNAARSQKVTLIENNLIDTLKNNGYHIYASDVNDGYDNCGDGSDETPGAEDWEVPTNLWAILVLPGFILLVIFGVWASRLRKEANALRLLEQKHTSEGESPVVESHVFLLITVLGGHFGLDKAYRGNYLLGILKMLTFGGLGLWWLVDVYIAAGDAGKSWISGNLRWNGRVITKAHITLWIAVTPLGFMGIDRAYRGDTLMGVFKMLTLGGLGLWWLADAYIAAAEAGTTWWSSTSSKSVLTNRRPDSLIFDSKKDLPLATIECPGCNAEMQVTRLGKSQNVTCDECGLSGEVEI